MRNIIRSGLISMPTLAVLLAVGLAATACSSDTFGGRADDEPGGVRQALNLPTELDVQAGTSDNFTIGTFADGTTVTVSEPPEGIDVSVGSAGDATTLTFDVATDAPLGTNTIDVTVSGDETITEQLVFNVIE